WLAYNWVDERFGIQAGQQAEVETLIAAAHRWHRQTQLPSYADTLDAMADRYADGLSEADVSWLAERIERHRVAAVAEWVPRVAPFLADLAPRQIERFHERGLERIEEAAEPLALAPDERLDRRVDEVEEQLERWLGDLSDEQTRYLREKLSKLGNFRARWVAHRRERLEEMTDLLSTADAAAIERQMLDWWIDLDTGYAPGYAEARRSAWQGFFALMVDFDARVSAQQRARAMERMRRYAREFRLLAADD
ncbi:MAG: DUF6279 family lipoprotein, partial [Gammaproteobacteria bacterium]